YSIASDWVKAVDFKHVAVIGENSHWDLGVTKSSSTLSVTLAVLQMFAVSLNIRQSVLSWGGRER
nr:hypothetical protein [Pseudomonadales bacterium]